MTDADAERFDAGMRALGETFQKEPTAFQQEIYFQTLQDLTVEQFEKACIQIIKTRTITGTFPLVAEIREAVKGGEESVEARIAIAWDMLMYAVERHGHYDSVRFDDPIIHTILKSWGGWLQWSGTVTNDELKWARKDFEKLYRAYATLEVRPDNYCIGAIEHENGLAGFSEFSGPVIAISGKPGAFETRPLPRLEPPQQLEDRGLDPDCGVLKTAANA